MCYRINRGLRYLAVVCCCLLGFATIVATGGGGGGGGGEQLPPAQNVTISGRVDDGTANSPIPNASCRFVETGGNNHGVYYSNVNGEYRMIVPPGVEGHVMCSPENLSYFQYILIILFKVPKYIKVLYVVIRVKQF